MTQSDSDRSLRLQSFVDWSAAHITGDEKGQAQIFLDRLFIAFGQRGSLDVGGKPEFRIKPGKEDAGGTSFADYVWKPVVLIEMKKRGIPLALHRQQAFNYWIKLVPHRPQYTILCNFDEFWVYDFNIDLDEPLDKLTLKELPARYDPLAFLFPTNEKPVFQNNRLEVTRAAADRLAAVFNHMTLRKVNRGLAQRFILQILIALFAEDIALLPKNFVTNLLAEIKSPEDSYDLLGGLFEAMNRPNGTPAGRFKGIHYFNGGIFQEPAKLALDNDGIELAHLRKAAAENWSKVSPEIFGTLFQDSMDKEERHAYGAHYTAAIDIMKIVGPTIVEPWTTLIDSAKKPKQLADLLERISMLQILDPACGSGNFLYIAYRELKRLETKIRVRLKTEFPTFQATLNHVTARQFHGMDILEFAIELAKVTMMIARKLSIDELQIADEPPLPLDNLDTNFLCQDALYSNAGVPPAVESLRLARLTGGQEVKPALPTVTPWPSADIIIGNPPFLGAKRLKPERGPDYVNALRKLYPEIPGMADYCVYWFRRAHDHLPACTPDRPESGRAGLVGTQNIRNNQSRVGGLDHIVKSGTIIEAVDNQPWSGEANVHVSIANWVKTAASDAMAGQSAGPEGQHKSSSARKGREGPRAAQRSPKGAAQIDPAKLLIPAQRKLWFKVDPKLAVFKQDHPGQSCMDASATVVTTPGKRGKIRQDKSYELAYHETGTINSALSSNADVSGKHVLICNKEPKRCFQGKIPGYDGFMLDADQAAKLRVDSADVIVPYLTGRELLNDFRIVRWAIDFRNMSMIEASSRKSAFNWCKMHVLPKVIESYELAKRQESDMESARKEHLDRWWQFWNRRDELTSVLSGQCRFIGCSRVTRRPVMVFLSSKICPSDLVQVFAFEDDYSFGILQSSLHFEWFRKSSRLKVETDLRYSVRDVFDTFPWPQSPSTGQLKSVANLGRKVRCIRATALRTVTGGLRALYRMLELPGSNELKDAQSALDRAVLDAYGFDSNKDLLSQLLLANREIFNRVTAGEAVISPGIPPTYSHLTDELVSHDLMEA